MITTVKELRTGDTIVFENGDWIKVMRDTARQCSDMLIGRYINGNPKYTPMWSDDIQFNSKLFTSGRVSTILRPAPKQFYDIPPTGEIIWKSEDKLEVSVKLNGNLVLPSSISEETWNNLRNI